MGTHPIFESDFDCLTEFKMPQNDKLDPEFGFLAPQKTNPPKRAELFQQPQQPPRHAKTNVSSGAKTIQNIPTLSDSVVLSTSVADYHPPPRREINIQSDMANTINVDFDFDLGLLTKNIPPKDLFNEETDIWDWEQEFSQLNAHFTSNR